MCEASGQCVIILEGTFLLNASMILTQRFVFEMLFDNEKLIFIIEIDVTEFLIQSNYGTEFINKSIDFRIISRPVKHKRLAQL